MLDLWPTQLKYLVLNLHNTKQIYIQGNNWFFLSFFFSMFLKLGVGQKGHKGRKGNSGNIFLSKQQLDEEVF